MPDEAPLGQPIARLIVTIGLHSSASTWVYNIVRELMIADRGEAQVAAVFADSVQELIANRSLAGRHVVWKAHHGGEHWPVFARMSRATVIVSVRDPRDAAVSLMRRFAVEPKPALRGIAQDCRRAMQCAETGCPVLRYEDRFFDDPATVAMLARLIGAAVPAATQARIFERYRTAAVRAFAETLDKLPAERRAGGDSLPHDRVTQIHRRHIDDGRIGKWREYFDAAQRREVTAYFAPFLARFGYPA